MTAQAQTTQPAGKQRWPIACRETHLTTVEQPDVFTAAKAVGLDGFEVTVRMDGTCPDLFGAEKPYSINTPDEVKRLTDDLAAHNVAITAFCLHNHFDVQPDEEVAFTIKVAHVAKQMGIRAIRIDVFPHKLEPDPFLDLAIDCGQRIIDGTKDTAVRFGVENHGPFTNRPEYLKKLFGGIASPRYGLTLDTGNFYWFGHPLSKVYEIIETFAPTVCHTHCKSIRYPAPEQEKQRPMGCEYGKFCCPITEGDIDFQRVTAILKKANYTGDLCIENESLSKYTPADRLEVLRQEAAFLRKLTTNA